LTWTVTAPDTKTGGGCEATITFKTQGQRQVSVTATNQHGSSSTETLTFEVGPEPENKPPVVTYFEIFAAEGPKGFSGGPFGQYACPTGFYCPVPQGAALWNGQV